MDLPSARVKFDGARYALCFAPSCGERFGELSPSGRFAGFGLQPGYIWNNGMVYGSDRAWKRRSQGRPPAFRRSPPGASAGRPIGRVPPEALPVIVTCSACKRRQIVGPEMLHVS
jgi:hypothetical protein